MSILLLLAACAPAGTDQGDSSLAAASAGAGGMPARPDRDDGTGKGGVGFTPGGGGALASTLSGPGAGSTFLGGGSMLARSQLLRDNLLQVEIEETASGWVERFLVGIPQQPHPPGGVPLLVAFHKFGGSEWDVFFRTSFFDEAAARGWYIVTPLSASTKHYGANEAQINTQLVLDFVLSFFGDAIDRDRIYGVGFSMGGGALLSYAARHVDPARGMFAALLSHTGGGSLWHTYGNSPDDDDADDDLLTGTNLEAPDIMDFWFGGAPQQFPFAYQCASIMDIDPTGYVNYDTSLITNLRHVPIHTWYASDDPQSALRALSDRIWDEFLNVYSGPSVLTTVAGDVHGWATLNEVAACDWLAQFTLQLPTSGRMLADSEGRWLYFDVVQETSGAFTSFEWTVDASQNALTLEETTNLLHIGVDTQEAGLDPDSALVVNLSSADGTGDEVRLRGVSQMPVTVMRDGVSDPNWTYLPPTQTLVITEAGGQHQWAVLFQ